MEVLIDISDEKHLQQDSNEQLGYLQRQVSLIDERLRQLSLGDLSLQLAKERDNERARKPHLPPKKSRGLTEQHFMAATPTNNIEVLIHLDREKFQTLRDRLDREYVKY